LHAKAATPLKKRDHDPADVMNIMDVTMRRFVKMAKRLPTFNDLSQCGKLAMLKSAMIDMLTIRGVTRLNAEKHCWNTPVLGDANVSCNIFDKLNDCTQKNRFLHFCKMLHEKVRKNETAINLMGLVVLFDESRAIVDDKDKLTARKHHDMYYNLLKRYVESLYGEEAPDMLQTVPEALKELRTVSTNAATLFLGRVKPGETEQLPTEFFKTAPDESSTAISKPTVQTNLSEGETS
jgi:nuclear receptor subfamily 1 group I